MAKYLDTGRGAPDQCLGAWLEREVRLGIRAFRAQLGFFSYGALESFAPTLRTAGQNGAPVRLVIGSNNGSLTQVDLARTWSIFDGLPDAKLTVVAYSNAMFHPKVIHVLRADNSQTAIVGSGNLTDRGLAWNVEASISLDSNDGDAPNVLDQISAAIDRWHTSNDDGVYLISSADDVRRLTAATLIDVPQPELPALPEPTAQHAALKAGRRSRLWRPSVPAAAADVAVVARRRAGQPLAPAATLQWCKELRSSDAQRVGAGTNPTGKLRLTESGFPIDHRTYFRQQFFQPAVWTAEVRSGGNTYEVANIDFDVRIHGQAIGVQTLAIDHAQHREAGQGNVVTVLAWGPQLSRRLRARSYIGNWVTIERRPDGTFGLSIERNKPAWAPQ